MTEPLSEPLTEPLTLTLEVSASPEHAFTTWTQRIDTWWPADHTVSGDPDAQILLEPREGGRILELTPDGTEHLWGRVTTWDPPRRLGYTWHLGSEPSAATDVLISFAPAPAGSSVEIRHTGWERLGAEADSWRDRNHQGWSTLLPHYERKVRDG